MKLGALNTGKQSNLNKDKVTEVRDFLQQHYEIRVNRLDPKPSRGIIKCKTDKFKYVDLDEISLHLAEEGIMCSDTLLRKIIKSPNYMTTFNPVTDYFQSMKGKWQGTSYIDLLAAHLCPREYHDNGKDYYRIRWYRYFKKWMAATAACALHNIPNPVQLVLVHEDEGIGKSYFFEYLTPQPLKHYLVNSKDSKEKFDLDSVFALNFLVLFDEMRGITSRNANAFKEVLQAKEYQVHFPREPYPKDMPRIGSPCGTSNKTPEKGGFIPQGAGYRRFLVIELESINQEYSKKVDVDQLWAEALALLDQDFDYTWNLEDFEEFKKVNERYKVETASTKYLRMYFKKPINGDGVWLQPQEILEHLMKNKLIKSDDKGMLSNENIGRALTQLGYNKKKQRRGPESVWTYQVNTVEF